MWLGECGYVPGVDELLREAAIRYFFVDSHAILFADGGRCTGVRAHLLRHRRGRLRPRHRILRASVERQVRLPGDPHYRDFYRDIGFDLPIDYIGPHIHPKGTGCTPASSTTPSPTTSCTTSGSTIRTPRAARRAARLAFPRQHGEAGAALAAGMDRPPIIVSPYDAELYGHWWYEGPIFLADLFRQLHFDQSTIQPITPGEYLDRHPTNQLATPCASSWGLKGYGEQWLNESNAWTWRHIHAAGERMVELARRPLGRVQSTHRAGAQAGGAGADARAGERLDLHHVDRDHRSLRHPHDSTSTSSGSTRLYDD
jgi:1,4-alpha-glucan branching enzyme